jgi:hypothetical protein
MASHGTSINQNEFEFFIRIKVQVQVENCSVASVEKSEVDSNNNATSGNNLKDVATTHMLKEPNNIKNATSMTNQAIKEKKEEKSTLMHEDDISLDLFCDKENDVDDDDVTIDLNPGYRRRIVGTTCCLKTKEHCNDDEPQQTLVKHDMDKENTVKEKNKSGLVQVENGSSNILRVDDITKPPQSPSTCKKDEPKKKRTLAELSKEGYNNIGTIDYALMYNSISAKQKPNSEQNSGWLTTKRKKKANPFEYCDRLWSS